VDTENKDGSVGQPAVSYGWGDWLVNRLIRNFAPPKPTEYVTPSLYVYSYLCTAMTYTCSKTGFELTELLAHHLLYYLLTVLGAEQEE
ncbi:hypothetical protein, partial [Candidatus Burkholderia verschuerenii]|uniref:hypothetical protein n=1 Tax=Candidatus Burkholderia verschuerenii TaxID=242163 RepID=UPI001E293FAD